jgi:alkaline phosphatase
MVKVSLNLHPSILIKPMLNYRKFLLVITIVTGIISGNSFAQKLTANHLHSHNDYKQNIPFLTAYYAGAGSIEADVYLLNGKLYVAHERNEIAEDRTLDELYLKPLAALFRKNGNKPYADTSKRSLILKKTIYT